MGEYFDNPMTNLTATARRFCFRGHCRAVRYAVAVMLSLFAVHAVPAIAQETIDDTPTSVSPPQLPTEVAVGAYLIGLSQVPEPSDPFPTADLEVFLNLSWHDPRLASEDENRSARVFQEEEAAEKLSEIWAPDVEVQNQVEQRQTESIELTIYADGSVDYEERFDATSLMTRMPASLRWLIVNTQLPSRMRRMPLIPRMAIMLWPDFGYRR